MKVLGSYPAPTSPASPCASPTPTASPRISGATLHVQSPTRPRPSRSSTPARPRSPARRSCSARSAADADGTVVDYAFDFDGNGTLRDRGRRLAAGDHDVRAEGPGHRRRPRHRRRGRDRPPAKLNVTVKDAPCVENPIIKIERATIVTQGADVAGGAGCFHGVTTDKAGVRTTTYTTTGHFRVNGLEVDTLAALRGHARVEAQDERRQEDALAQAHRAQGQGRGHGQEDRLHVPRGLDQLGALAAPRSPASSSTPTPASAACALKVLGPPDAPTPTAARRSTSSPACRPSCSARRRARRTTSSSARRPTRRRSARSASTSTRSRSA